MTESFTTADADRGASVDKTYRPFGLAKGNVYVTGAGLFPTAGSWNREFEFVNHTPSSNTDLNRISYTYNRRICSALGQDPRRSPEACSGIHPGKTW